MKPEKNVPHGDIKIYFDTDSILRNLSHVSTEAYQICHGMRRMVYQYKNHQCTIQIKGCFYHMYKGQGSQNEKGKIKI